MSGRIPCINPNCRRTAANDKHPGSTWIICGKCYRALPGEYRQRWKALNARSRRLARIDKKLLENFRNRQWWRISIMYDRAWDRLKEAIVHYFTAPEKPIGIEDFLKENGLA